KKEEGPTPIAAPTSTAQPPDNAPVSPPAPAQEVPARNILISEVQITGGASDHDFISIVNPNNQSVSVGGWRLKKKTKSGTEYSIKVFPEGSNISGGGRFIWANSKNGFAESVRANTSSTQTLSLDTSIVLIDSGNRIMDSLAWGSGHIAPYIEGEAYPENPAVNQKLTRKQNGLDITDTDNNKNDFEMR
ncbi:MAG: lamin tail domain-containing protein, partial [Patescibacteria group bacterium]